jgi:hypothetical protein
MVLAGELGRGPGLPLGCQGVCSEADHRDAAGGEGTWLSRGGRDGQIRGVALSGEIQPLLQAGTRAAEDDDRIGMSWRVGARPHKEEGGEHEEHADDHADNSKDPPKPVSI